MDGFADPWEHLRLLADVPRNEALVSLLRRRAPGATVVEVGCGTGVLSCIAARVGAERVIAIEPTGMAEVARALVSANGLHDRVEVRVGRIQDWPAERADLVFSELLNAEPFAEDLLRVSRIAGQWVRRGGHLAPHRLEVWIGLVRESASAREAERARTAVQQLGQAHDLDLGAVASLLAAPGPYAYLAERTTLVSAPVRVFATDLRNPEEPSEVVVEVPVATPTVASGVALWFRAALDDDLWLENPPHAPGHWGTQILAWPREIEVATGIFRLRAVPDDTGFAVEPVASRPDRIRGPSRHRDPR